MYTHLSARLAGTSEFGQAYRWICMCIYIYIYIEREREFIVVDDCSRLFVFSCCSALLSSSGQAAQHPTPPPGPQGRRRHYPTCYRAALPCLNATRLMQPHLASAALLV